MKVLSEVQSELKECLVRAQETMKRNFDEGVRPTPVWEVGEKAWLSSRHISTTRPSPKLSHRWLGPFTITKKVSQSAYKLLLPESMKGIHPVFHVSVLRKFEEDEIEGRVQAPPEPVEIEGEDEWEVEAVLDKRKRRNKIEYLVSWKGYGAEDDTWEPVSNLENCKELVVEFEERFPNAEVGKKRSRRMK